jgi:hypothetical protein
MKKKKVTIASTITRSLTVVNYEVSEIYLIAKIIIR